MNILILYLDAAYEQTKKVCAWTGKHIAKFDKVIQYKPSDIDEAFYKANEAVLSQKRGAGLWIWKPYFLLRTLQEAKDGDVVFYADSGSFFIRNVKALIDSIDEKGIWCFDLPLLEKQYTKKQTFRLMECDNERFRESNQICATFLAVRNSKSTRQIMKEWLDFCKIPEIIMPSDNSEVEEKYFLSHREDQSVLSLVLKRHNIQPQASPTIGRIYPIWETQQKSIFSPLYQRKENYKVILCLHKKRKVTFAIVVSQLLRIYTPTCVMMTLIKKLRK